MLFFDNLLDILSQKSIVRFFYLNNEVLLAANRFSWSSLTSNIRRSANFWLGISGCLNDPRVLNSVDRVSFKFITELLNECLLYSVDTKLIFYIKDLHCNSAFQPATLYLFEISKSVFNHSFIFYCVSTGINHIITTK
jgi:hypothetical protein